MRIQYYDLLRAIAIVFVVGIHLLKVPSDVTDIDLYILLPIRQAINLAVPLFLAISGFFLANKDLTSTNKYFSFLRPQISRVLLPYACWGLIYSLFYLLLKEPLIEVAFRLITFQIAVPFYFIALIIQYYILLPWMQKLGSSLTGLRVSVLVSLISCIVIYYLRYILKISLPTVLYAGIFPTWISFFVLGIYVKKNGVKSSNISLIIFSLLFFTLSILETVWLANKYGQTLEAFTAVKASSFLYSFAVIACLFKQNKEKISSTLAYIGKVSFGIFFAHMLVYVIVNALIPKSASESIIVQFGLMFIVIGICTIMGIISRKINLNAAQKYLGF